MLLGTRECDPLKGYEIIGRPEPGSLINWPRDSQTVAWTLSQNSSWPRGESGSHCVCWPGGLATPPGGMAAWEGGVWTNLSLDVENRCEAHRRRSKGLIPWPSSDSGPNAVVWSLWDDLWAASRLGQSRAICEVFFLLMDRSAGFSSALQHRRTAGIVKVIHGAVDMFEHEMFPIRAMAQFNTALIEDERVLTASGSAGVYGVYVEEQ